MFNILKICFMGKFFEFNKISQYYCDDLYDYYWNEQFCYLFFYIFASFFLTLILFFVAFFLSQSDSTFEKLSVYECGFEPFGNSHGVFSIQFFIVGILFTIFDLELAYLFPWVINLGNLPRFSFWLMIFFLILLIIGFVYEWKKGALDWV